MITKKKALNKLSKIYKKEIMEHGPFKREEVLSMKPVQQGVLFKMYNISTQGMNLDYMLNLYEKQVEEVEPHILGN